MRNNINIIKLLLRVMMLDDMKEKKELYAERKERARDMDNWRT